MFFSSNVPDGVFLSGKNILHHEWLKELKSGNREVRVIEAQGVDGKTTGILMFDLSGRVLFCGACKIYYAGKKASFIVQTTKNIFKV